MVSQCSASTNSNNVTAVEGIEGLLQNIGVFGKEISHDDVECIVSELGEEEKDARVSADQILSKIL